MEIGGLRPLPATGCTCMVQGKMSYGQGVNPLSCLPAAAAKLRVLYDHSAWDLAVAEGGWEARS